mmetsp:Transcript_35786/g.100655  ORF Transcript_35786/g.100655 Transcript_35786/m.100655 type:complete len:249 (+) Transcript_35786:131-877(+)
MPGPPPAQMNIGSTVGMARSGDEGPHIIVEPTWIFPRGRGSTGTGYAGGSSGGPAGPGAAPAGLLVYQVHTEGRIGNGAAHGALAVAACAGASGAGAGASGNSGASSSSSGSVPHAWLASGNSGTSSSSAGGVAHARRASAPALSSTGSSLCISSVTGGDRGGGGGARSGACSRDCGVVHSSSFDVLKLQLSQSLTARYPMGSSGRSRSTAPMASERRISISCLWRYSFAVLIFSTFLLVLPPSHAPM